MDGSVNLIDSTRTDRDQTSPNSKRIKGKRPRASRTDLGIDKGSNSKQSSDTTVERNHTSSDRRYLIEKQDDWSLYFLNIDGNIYLEGRYRVTYAGNWPNVRSSSTIPLNTWTHVAFSFSRSAGKLRVYINGSEVGSTNSNGAMTSTSYPIGLGAGYWGNPRNYIDGAIDEVRFWDVARSQSDIN